MNDVAMDIGQPEIAARVTVSQLLMIHAQQMQNRGMEIVQMDLVLGCEIAVIVRLAVSHATLKAATRHEHGKAAWVVISTIVGR